MNLLFIPWYEIPLVIVLNPEKIEEDLEDQIPITEYFRNHKNNNVLSVTISLG